MNNWKTYTLGKLVDIRRGASPRPVMDPKYFGGSIPWIKIGDATATPSRFIDSTKEFVTEAGKDKSVFLTKGSLVFSNSGSAAIPFILGMDGCIHDGWISFSNYNGINKLFLFYWLKTNTKYIRNLATGSVFINLNTTMVKDFKILLPSIEEQQHIAQILGSFDDKIELNLEINKTLEEMAIAFYKEWFVDFGPFKDGEFVDLELGPIPKGWEIISLSDIVQINNKSYKPFNYPENEFFHYSIPAFDEKNYPKIEFGKDIASNKTFINDKVILVSKLNPRIRRIWTVIPEDHYISFSSTEFINFQPRNIIDWGYINCYLRNELFYNEFLSHATGTTGSRQRVSPKETLNFKIILPQDQIRERFNDLSAPIFKLIVRNINENQDLIAIRDYLLPKLISGEVKVKNITRQTTTTAG